MCGEVEAGGGRGGARISLTSSYKYPLLFLVVGGEEVQEVVQRRAALRSEFGPLTFVRHSSSASKASEPTVGADSSGGVKEAKGLQAELLADLEELRRERAADRAKIEKLQAALAEAQDARHRRSSEGVATKNTY